MRTVSPTKCMPPGLRANQTHTAAVNQISQLRLTGTKNKKNRQKKKVGKENIFLVSSSACCQAVCAGSLDSMTCELKLIWKICPKQLIVPAPNVQSFQVLLPFYCLRRLCQNPTDNEGSFHCLL